MAKNPFRTTVGANDPIFQKAMLQARFGKQFREDQVRNIVGGLGGDFAQGGFELADLMTPSAPNIAGLNPQEVAKRFAGQLQGSRRMLPGQELDWSKLSADIDLSDLLGANPDNNPLYSRNVNLQNLLSAGTDFSKAVQSQLTPMMASRLGGANLSEGATAQAFIDAIKRDPNAGDPTATFTGLEGAPTLSYSELQAQAATDPFSRNVLERIRDFTNTYDPSAPDKPMGQEQATFDAAVAAGVAEDAKEAARIEAGGYDDSALRTQLAEQQDLIRSLSERLNQPVEQTETQAMLQQLLGRESLGSSQLQEILAQSQEGRVTEDAISQIIQNQLTQADIRGQVGQAVQSEFGDVFTQAMIDRQSAEQQRFDALMQSLSARQQQEEQLAREQFARQDAIREQQEAAVGETIREAERAGQSAYENVRGLPLYEADFSATDPLRQSIQDAITSRLGGTDLDAMATERYAQLEEDAASQRAALTERLSRLGLLRQGGDTADVLGEFEGQVVRGRQGIASDLQQMQQDLITQGITAGTDFRGRETDTELRRIDQRARQTQAARDLDLQRHMLQQDVADRVLARGLTRLGPTERERFENQLRAQQQSEYLDRSALAQTKELAESELEQRKTEFTTQQEFAERQLTQQTLEASKERGFRRYAIEQERAEAQLNRAMERDFAEIDRQLREGEIDSREAEAQKNRKFQENQNFFDRQLQQNLAEQQNQFSLDLQEGQFSHQSAESLLDRQQQLTVMRNENEQRLAERNLQESEANLNRLQQTSERIAAEGFQRGLVTREETQRQSDRDLQKLLEDNRLDLTKEQNRLDRENQLELALQSRNFQRDQAELDRTLQQTESAFQRGMITSEAALDRTFESTRAWEDRQHTSAQNQLQRDFQRALLDDEQEFNREQNEFLRQERENTQEFQANEALLQRGFISEESYLERQNALDVENRRFANERTMARDQRDFMRGQATADRQQALKLMREQHNLEDQRLITEHNFAREMQSQENAQRQSDRDHQFNLQQLVEGRITEQAALDRAHSINLQNHLQDRIAEENVNAFFRDKQFFDAEIAQRKLDREETVRQFNSRQAQDVAEFEESRLQFGRQQNFLESEAIADRQFATAQSALDRQFARDQWEESKLQFGRQQSFAEEEAHAQRQFATAQANLDRGFARDQFEESKRQFGRQQEFAEAQNLAQLQRQDMQFTEAQRQFGVQADQFDRQLAATEAQFTRQQNFAEQQAQQDALYRAIGTLLAAQDSGMDLGIGTGPDAPGGLPALLRGELGAALGIDLSRMGYVEPTSAGGHLRGSTTRQAPTGTSRKEP